MADVASTSSSDPTRRHHHASAPKQRFAGLHDFGREDLEGSRVSFDVPEDDGDIAPDSRPRTRTQSQPQSRSGSRSRSQSRHIQTDANDTQGKAWPSTWRGSYPHASLPRSRISSGANTPKSSYNAFSSAQLELLMEKLQLEKGTLETYGVEELRDGFFDAPFFRPPINKALKKSLRRRAKAFSFKTSIQNQKDGILRFCTMMVNTRRGRALFQSILGYMIAYIICLIPVAREWLGRYNFIMVIATILNHSGRTISAQIEGTISCIAGAAFGLGSGALAQYISTCTSHARDNFGALLAPALVILISVLAWSRARFVRLFQPVISAGIALLFLTIQHVGEDVSYRKVFDFGIPWIFGLLISLIVNLTVFPDAGGRDIASALHRSMCAAIEGLRFPRQASAEQHGYMSLQMVNLSEGLRDMKSEITISVLRPDDMTELRNLLQAVIRDLLRIDPEAPLFADAVTTKHGTSDEGNLTEIMIEMERKQPLDYGDSDENYRQVIGLVRRQLAQPTKDLLNAMMHVISVCDIHLMKLSKHTRMLSKEQLKSDVTMETIKSQLDTSKMVFDAADSALLDVGDLPPFEYHIDLVKIFLFIHPIRQAADHVSLFMEKVITITKDESSFRRMIWLPCYSWHKGLYRSSPQVRHDRGGMTAGYYFRSKKNLDNLMGQYAWKPFEPIARLGAAEILQQVNSIKKVNSNTKRKDEAEIKPDETTTFRYKVWKVFHHLQGFETKFAFKVMLTTVLLSVPAWLKQSRGWWNEWEAWWGVITVWLLMQPRVGGSIQDLTSRLLVVVIAAVWGALAVGVKNGNPYVTVVFAFLIAIPYFYRFTISSHPRSGLMGCITFTVVSLSSITLKDNFSPQFVAYTRGIAILVGVFASVVVNWCLWPFVARHELRKSLSTMLLNLGIQYRGVIAKYLYHDLNKDPTQADMARSELQESHLREGFVRMRELLQMTAHELRLRGPFNPLPYSQLIDSSEKFFEHLTDIRQASLYVRLTANEDVAREMMSVRRDAVATVLMNLWVLAGGLRAKHPIPRYLPSAAIARKKLLMRFQDMDQTIFERRNPPASNGMPGVDGSAEAEKSLPEKRRKRWINIYEYAYALSLTDIIGELEQLQIHTKAITGELGLGNLK